LVLYDKCTASYFRDEEEAKRKLEAISEKWDSIEKIAIAHKALLAK
jgi:serine/threonine-protein phosphatase 2A regulatory subunit B'